MDTFENKERLIVSRIKVFLIHLFWKIFVLLSCIIPKKRITKIIPENFQIFYGFNDSLDKDGLIKAYKKVFSDPPWNELWESRDILEKLKRETDSRESVIALMKDNNQSICGFSWGQVLDVNDLEEKIQLSLGLMPNGLADLVKKRGIEKLFYLYEIAILTDARGGLNPLRFLIYSGLELASREKVYQSLFWSTPESKIVNLALLFGYEPIFKCKDQSGHDIVFFLHSNHWYILKLLELLDEKKVEKLMRFLKKILSRK